MNNEKIDKAVEDAKAVYSDACDHTREAIDYMANVLRVECYRPATAAGTIDRWDLDRAIEATMEPSDTGDYVLYADHLQHVAAAVAEAEEQAGYKAALDAQGRITDLIASLDSSNRAIANHTAYINELEAKLRAATAPVSAVPDVLEALETLYHALPDILPSGAYQRFLNTGKWAAGNAYADRGIMARLEYRADDMETVYAAMDQARAALPPSAGAPVSGAEQAGAAQNEANSPQTRMDAQSKLLLDTSAGGQELPALPEPDVIGYTCIGDNDAYSPAKLREHGKVCARAALEWAASICDEMTAHWASYKDTALLNGDVELSNAASGEPRAGEFLATAIRALAAKQAGKEG